MIPLPSKPIRCPIDDRSYADSGSSCSTTMMSRKFSAAATAFTTTSCEPSGGSVFVRNSMPLIWPVLVEHNS